jgi:hypothetical protein
MKEKTVKDLATIHNRLARLNNLISKIDPSEFDEDEQKKLKKIHDQAIKLILDFSRFKIKALESRKIEIPSVW